VQVCTLLVTLVPSLHPYTGAHLRCIVPQDPHLTAQWLASRFDRPLLKAAKHGLWQACQRLAQHRGHHTLASIYLAAYFAAKAGATQPLSALLEAAQQARRDAPAPPIAELEKLHADILHQAYMEAARSRQAGSCELLQQYHPQLGPREWMEGGPLSKAVVSGNADAVSTMLDACKASLPAEAYSTLQLQALRSACSHGQATVVQAVLDRGADVNAGCPAFHGANSLLATAMHAEAWEVVRLLLAHGVHVHACSNGSTRHPSALAHAAPDRNNEACRVLLECDRVKVTGEELVAAVDSCDVSLLHCMLEREGNMTTVAT
jgi:hypothetical protein